MNQSVLMEPFEWQIRCWVY